MKIIEIKKHYNAMILLTDLKYHFRSRFITGSTVYFCKPQYSETVCRIVYFEQHCLPYDKDAFIVYVHYLPITSDCPTARDQAYECVDFISNITNLDRDEQYLASLLDVSIEHFEYFIGHANFVAISTNSIERLWYSQPKEKEKLFESLSENDKVVALMERHTVYGRFKVNCYKRSDDQRRGKYFDFVHIEFPLYGDDGGKDRRKWLKENKKLVDKYICYRLQNNKQYQKYNIPINFLKCYTYKLIDDILIVEFELKKLKEE